MEKILSDFGVQPILLAAQIVNFLVLLFILQKLLYKPILKVLDERKRKIEESLLNAEKIQKELEETEAKRESIINKAIEESKKIVAEANEQNNLLMQEAREKAKEEMEQMIAQAQQMIAGEKEKMKGEIKAEFAGMVQLSLEKVLGSALDNKSKQNLVDESIKQIKS